MNDIDPILVMVLLSAALAAGWFDAVVGGGGLIQLPALLLAFPTTSPVTLVGTDKLSSTVGTASAAARFAAAGTVSLRGTAPMAASAVVAAGLGTACMGVIPERWVRAAILTLLVVVLAIVVSRPALGEQRRLDVRRGRVVAGFVLVAALLPFYNGMVGPGTGTMMVVALTMLQGVDFLTGSAMAKVVNVGANVGALLVAAATSEVLWALGGLMAVANIAGAQVGVRCALRHGTGFVRYVLVIVVVALIATLVA